VPAEGNGDLQTLICVLVVMSHIIKSYPLTKLNDGLSRLHSVDEVAVSWLTIMVHDMHTRRRRQDAKMASYNGMPVDFVK